MELQKVYILNKPVHLCSMGQALEYIDQNIRIGKKQFIIAQNPEKIIKETEDEELSSIVENKATLLIADGVGLIYAGRMLRLPHISRVTGVGLFEKLLEIADNKGKRLFLYGSKPKTIQKAEEIIKARYPGLELVGIQDGYEKDMEKVIQRIEETKPDFLFVALGSPRQEKWIAKHIDRLPVQLVMGVGGSFDVLTGDVKRAPVWMQKLGIEWLYRLIKQPSRITRMTNLPKFLWLVLKNR